MPYLKENTVFGNSTTIGLIRIQHLSQPFCPKRSKKPIIITVFKDNYVILACGFGRNGIWLGFCKSRNTMAWHYYIPNCDITSCSLNDVTYGVCRQHYSMNNRLITKKCYRKWCIHKTQFIHALSELFVKLWPLSQINTPTSQVFLFHIHNKVYVQIWRTYRNKVHL